VGQGRQSLAVGAPVFLERPLELAVDVVDGIGAARAGVLVRWDDAVGEGGDGGRLLHGEEAPGLERPPQEAALAAAAATAVFRNFLRRTGLDFIVLSGLRRSIVAQNRYRKSARSTASPMAL